MPIDPYDAAKAAESFYYDMPAILPAVGLAGAAGGAALARNFGPQLRSYYQTSPAPGVPGTSRPRRAPWDFPTKRGVAGPRAPPSNNAATTVVVRKKRRKRKRKAKRPAFNSRQKKSLRRICKTSCKNLLTFKDSNHMKQISCAANKVGWSMLFELGKTEAEARLNYKILGNDNLNTTTRLEEIDQNTFVTATSAQNGVRYYFRDQLQFHLKNNTNFPCEVVFYLVKSTDFTVQDFLTELTEVRKAAYGDTSVLAKEDDFNQFYTVVGIPKKSRKWKIAKRLSMDLSGGQEAKLSFSPSASFDPGQVYETGDAEFFRGSWQVVARIMGKPAHSAATTSSLLMANAMVDMRVTYKQKTYMTNSRIIQPNRQLANTDFAAVADPVLAEPEAPNVGVYDDV